MARQPIDLTRNSGVSDSMAVAWDKVEQNFTDIYAGDFANTGSISTDGKIEMWNGQDGGWRDMIGQIIPRANVVTSPTWTQMGTSPFWAYLFAPNDEVWIPYHIQHDYSPGTDIYMHVHWTTNGTSTGAVTWQFDWCFAKGFDQANFPIAASSPLGYGTVTVAQEAAGTAWRHMVAEINTPISDDFEVDGLLLVHIKRIANTTSPVNTNGDNVFMLVADCHYQTNTTCTKNRIPNFYSP